MAIKVEINQLDGSAVAGAGTADTRAVGGVKLTQGTHKSAQGHLELAEDNETVVFVPDDPTEFEAVEAADA